MGGIEWRGYMIRPREGVLVLFDTHACMLGAGALLAIRRTVRRPRLTVPTNLQAVIVVDILYCVWVEPWRANA